MPGSRNESSVAPCEGCGSRAIEVFPYGIRCAHCGGARGGSPPNGTSTGINTTGGVVAGAPSLKVEFLLLGGGGGGGGGEDEDSGGGERQAVHQPNGKLRR